MRVFGMTAGCLLLLSVSTLVHALPPGYKDDFNGCATQSPDEASRKECCAETLHDCMNQCGGVQERIACHTDCLDGYVHCEDGRTLPIVAWPGGLGTVPGLTAEADHLVAERGRELVASTSAVLVQLRGKDESVADACVAFVVACACPAGSDAKGLECRAAIEGKGTACRICAHGAKAESCKPCPDCRPELLSAQPCEAAERRAPRPAAPKK